VVLEVCRWSDGEVVSEAFGFSGLPVVVGGEDDGGEVDMVGSEGASGSGNGWQMVSLRFVLCREMVGSGI
jgi:hypothetical protein